MQHPSNFRELVLATFRSGDNFRYLQTAMARAPLPPAAKQAELAGLLSAVGRFADGTGRALGLSDPLAQRADLRPALELWDEVQRLNRAFLAERAAAAAARAVYFDPGVADAARLFPAADPAEDYAFQAFTADSLRPPGLETLNVEPYSSLYLRGNAPPGRGLAVTTPGGAPAAFQWTENRPPQWYGPAMAPACGAPDRPQPWRKESALFRAADRVEVARALGRREGFAGRREPAAGRREGFSGDYSRVAADGAEPIRAAGEAAWPLLVADTAGAMARQGDFGPDLPVLDPSVPAADRPWRAADPRQTPEETAAAYRAAVLGGPAVATTLIGAPLHRFERYPEIPLWQTAGRRDYERDIGETLGQAHTEYESQVRGWDMEPLTAGGPCGRGSYYGKYNPA